MSQVKAKQLEGVHADQLLDNLITAIVDPTINEDVALGYKPSSVWVNTTASPHKVFICSDNSIGAAVWIELKESSGASLTVTQALHGYSLCEVLKYNGTSYVRAQSDVQANVGIWLITKIIDANTFVISTNGYFTGLTGGTADTTGYLSSTTPGGLVTTAPAISQPIIYWTTATTGWVLGYPSSRAAVAPSSTPLGYNDIRVSFTGANWNYEGLTNNGGGISLAGSIAVSGVAGWRYLVVDALGVVSVEAIPPAEIVSDIFQYTPTPTFDIPNNAYYSSATLNNRIIAIGYFDVANLLTVRPYGHGAKKNDDYWETNQSGVTATTANTRLQFTGTWDKTWGNNIVCVDNGGAVVYDDTEGFRITFQKGGKAKIGAIFAGDGSAIAINKKGALYKTYMAHNPSTPNSYFLQIDINVSAGDFFTFYLAITSIGSEINSFTISFEEL